MELLHPGTCAPNDLYLTRLHIIGNYWTPIIGLAWVNKPTPCTQRRTNPITELGSVTVIRLACITLYLGFLLLFGIFQTDSHSARKHVELVF